MQIEKALTIDHLRISTIYIFNNLKIRTAMNAKISVFVICDCNGIQTHNHLVRKRTLNHLDHIFVII